MLYYRGSIKKKNILASFCTSIYAYTVCKTVLTLRQKTKIMFPTNKSMSLGVGKMSRFSTSPLPNNHAKKKMPFLQSSNKWRQKILTWLNTCRLQPAVRQHRAYTTIWKKIVRTFVLKKIKEL